MQESACYRFARDTVVAIIRDVAFILLKLRHFKNQCTQERSFEKNNDKTTLLEDLQRPLEVEVGQAAQVDWSLSPSSHSMPTLRLVFFRGTSSAPRCFCCRRTKGDKVGYINTTCNANCRVYNMIFLLFVIRQIIVCRVDVDTTTTIPRRRSIKTIFSLTRECLQDNKCSTKL